MAGIYVYQGEAGWEAGQRVVLSREEAQHAVKARRAREGSELVLLNGHGVQARAVIVRTGGETEVEVLEVGQQARVRRRVTLAVGLLKAKAMDQVVQKATELGVAEIWPVVTARCEAREAGERETKRQERWLRLVIEAMKQCGNAWQPRIEPVVAWEGFLERQRGFEEGARLVASTDARAAALRETDGGGRCALLLVGPEGDFSGEEYAEAAEAGFRAVTLGPLILRAETAVVVALAGLLLA